MSRLSETPTPSSAAPGPDTPRTRIIETTIGGVLHRFETPVDPISAVVNTLVLEGTTYAAVDFVRNVRVVLDVGANVGAASLFFAATYPDATVYAFEPSRHAYELLTRNVADLSNVECYPFGLYPRTLETELFAEAPGAMTASVDANTPDAVVSEVVHLRSVLDWLEEHAVTQIDVLKIDTEGCEVAILETIAAMLPFVKVAYIEFHSEDDRKKLDEILGGTHVMVRASIYQLHRGEVTYVAKDAFPSERELSRDAIHVDL